MIAVTDAQRSNCRGFKRDSQVEVEIQKLSLDLITITEVNLDEVHFYTWNHS